MNRTAALLALVCLLTADASSQSGVQTAASAPARGVLVSHVEEGSAAAAAGLQAGDLLIAWTPERSARTLHARAGEPRALDDPIDFERLHAVRAALGVVTFEVTREGQRMPVAFGHGEWGVRVRSDLDAGRSLLAARRHDEALRVMQETAEEAGGPARAWILRQVADVLAKRNRPADALQKLEAALELEDADSLFAAHLLASMSAIARRRARLDDAERWAERALAIQLSEAPDTAEAAAGHAAVGQVALARRQLDRAEAALRAGLAMAEASAAGSSVHGDLLEGLALVAQRRGQLDTAQPLYERTLAVREAAQPGSIAHANAFNNLAVLASMRGDLHRADEMYARATDILEGENPDGLDIAGVLNNLGILCMLRGDLERAETVLRRSLDIKRALGSELGSTYHNLGLLAVERRDLAEAARLFDHSLEHKRRVAAKSDDVASSLSTLAGVERQRGRLEQAEALAGQALAIRRELMPGTLELGFTLTELGRIHERQGRLSEAVAVHREALALREQKAPDSTSVAETLDRLAALDVAQGNLSGALATQERALAIWVRLAPGSLNEAAAHLALGRTAQRLGDRDRALAEFRRAADALEVQSGRLGGTQEAKAGFRASIAGYYSALMDELLARKQVAEAFHVLERSRARAFLALLAERDVRFGADVPEELARARSIAARQYDDIQGQLARRTPKTDAAAIEDLLGRLRDVQREQADIARRIREASPRLASLHYPVPLDAAAAASSLAPGALLLSFSVGEGQSWVFVLSRERPVRAIRLAIGSAELGQQVDRFRRLVERGRTAAAPVAVDQPARELYDALLAPLGRELTSARSLVIVPDGPLHLLPFAPLRPPDGRYLGTSRPVHVVSSATVYHQLAEQRRAADPPLQLVAFGDPAYAGTSEQNGSTAFEPLPGTRREVQAIARLLQKDVEVHVGAEASESRAVSRMGAGRFVHIALHGVLNDRLPLNSGLAFAAEAANASAGSNGLLQAWEVFERVRLQSDLVVLSACDTALGAEYGPEGLLGLTRAFQYAGAPAVVSSLWRIPDDASAVLMEAFYRGLRSGRRADRALADAQRVVLADRRFRHPYFWAGLVLNGNPHARQSGGARRTQTD